MKKSLLIALTTFDQKIREFFGSRRGVIALVICVGVFGFINLTQAQGFARIDFDLDLGESNKTLRGFAELAAMGIQIFTFLSLFILSLAGDLLGTEFITGPEAEAALKPLWITIRNLTNIGFVVMLVYLSFSNIIASFTESGGSSVWKIKEKLPRLILAIIAVNFSFLGFKLAIDAVHMGTVAIFSIADVQLEANSATSVNDILKNSTWTLLPQETVDNDTSDKYELSTAPAAKPGQICEISKPIEGKIYYVNAFDGHSREIPKTRYKNKIMVCTSFSKTINDVFCAEGKEADNCFFRIKDDLSKNSIISSSNDTAQNLFMAFGTVFMKLERLPMLAADIKDLLQVIDNTLFSLILAAAYVFVLAALFIVLILRVVVLWLGIVLSPVIVAGSIMGLGTSAITDKLKLSTMLILPLKVAAAFSVSFVMLSGMVEFHAGGKEGIFEFGAGLSSLAVDEYAILWQVLTIVVFWMTARWALEGTEADKMVNGILDGAENIGGHLAKAATLENQIFTIRDKDGNVEQRFGLEALRKAPMGFLKEKNADREYNRNEFLRSIGADGFHNNESASNLGLVKAENYKDLESNEVMRRKALTDIIGSVKDEKALVANSAGIIKTFNDIGLMNQLTIANKGVSLTKDDITMDKMREILNTGTFKSAGQADISKDSVRNMFGTYDGGGTNVLQTSNSVVNFSVANPAGGEALTQGFEAVKSDGSNAAAVTETFTNFVNTNEAELKETDKGDFESIFANHSTPKEILIAIDAKKDIPINTRRMLRKWVTSMWSGDDSKSGSDETAMFDAHIQEYIDKGRIKDRDAYDNGELVKPKELDAE